ncbi:MAG: hypothetical protein HY360_04405 [Verrucomicrobia bacterium]|nr:hypothetical protein [Verrucomicrobiota bacterium]
MNPKTLIPTTLALVLMCAAASAQNEPVKLIADASGEMEIPYGEQRTIEFTCPWDGAKTPTVLDFQARIDTPGKTKLTGGPCPLLTIELNGDALDGERLLNKPLKSARERSSECIWYERPKWGLMYTGAWDPPANDYTPKAGSPTRFVLDVSDFLKAKEKNKLVLTYCDCMVNDEKTGGENVTLAEYCHRQGHGDATLMFGEMCVRPRKDTDTKVEEGK